MFEDFDIIFAYTRKQAIADGVLVDVTATAQEAGIKFPTALTRAVWEQYVRVPEGLVGQDEAGRLWDVIWLLRCAIQASMNQDQLLYQVKVRYSDQGTATVSLKAHCGPDDDGAPCITVMLPEED